MPAESRWHPPPATADTDSCGEQVPVPEVMKAMRVSKASEVVSWEVRAMTERVNAPRSAAHAVHAAHAWAGNVVGTASIATTTAHPIVILRSMTILPICHPRIIVRAQCKMFK